MRAPPECRRPSTHPGSPASHRRPPHLEHEADVCSLQPPPQQRAGRRQLLLRGRPGRVQEGGGRQLHHARHVRSRKQLLRPGGRREVCGV